MLKFYGSLVAETPLHAWRASDTIGRVAFILLLIAVLFFGWRGEIPAEVLGWGLLAMVVLALLQANYDRYAQTRSVLDSMFERDHQELDRQIANHRHWFAQEALADELRRGHADLFVKLRSGDTAPGNEGDWAALIELWEADCFRVLSTHMPHEMDYYSLDVGLIEGVSDWEGRLAGYMRVKLERLAQIIERDEEAQKDEPPPA